jgi:DNA-binding NtrC family response regulator
MKLAVVFEKDAAANEKTTRLLKWFGYTTASVRSAQEAFNVVGALLAHVIVLYAASDAEERRAIPNELKRLVPASTIILMTDTDADYAAARGQSIPGVDVVMQRPVSADALRRVLEPELEFCRPQPRIVPDVERRKR